MARSSADKGAMKAFAAPKKPPFLKYVKVTDESLVVLENIEERAHYDKLCGALVRYMQTGLREDDTLPKPVRASYVALLGGMDRVRQGAMNSYEGRKRKEADEGPATFSQESDENLEAFCEKPDENLTENLGENYTESYTGFQGTTGRVPAETHELGKGQPPTQPPTQPLNEPPTQYYESESGSESGVKEERVRIGIECGEPEIDEDTKMKLITAANKLIVLTREHMAYEVKIEDAKASVRHAYTTGGMEAVNHMIESLLPAKEAAMIHN